MCNTSRLVLPSSRLENLISDFLPSRQPNCETAIKIMRLEYDIKKVVKSWAITPWGRRITFGFWINVATDRVIKDHPEDAELFRSYYRYLHRKLEHPNDIRVLELAPGAPDDPLRARIIHIPHIPSTTKHGILGWSGQYEALSYTWGTDRDDTSYIIVDDKYSFEIRPNLNDALRRLRSPKVSRTLWVDAICVNQNSIEERNTQIALMLDVYARAENVQIWLGTASADSAIGMKALKYLAENTLQEPAPWDQIPDDTFFPALNGIFQREWFQRMWVVQEACVSRKATMTCGTDSFQWENNPGQIMKFIRRIKYVAISPQWEQAGLSQVNMDIFLQMLDLQMQHIERQQGEILRSAPDILDVAYSTRHRKATDRRDKLFATMGLVSQRDESFF